MDMFDGHAAGEDSKVLRLVRPREMSDRTSQTLTGRIWENLELRLMVSQLDLHRYDLAGRVLREKHLLHPHHNTRLTKNIQTSLMASREP